MQSDKTCIENKHMIIPFVSNIFDFLAPNDMEHF